MQISKIHIQHSLSSSCPKRLPSSSETVVLYEATHVNVRLRLHHVLLLRFTHFHADQSHQIRLLALHVHQLSLCFRQLCLKLAHLLLKLAYCTCTPINRVSDPSICLINHAAHSICSLGLWQLLKNQSMHVPSKFETVKTIHTHIPNVDTRILTPRF